MYSWLAVRQSDFATEFLQSVFAASIMNDDRTSLIARVYSVEMCVVEIFHKM